MILPPDVLVVRNQAETENTLGPAIGVCVVMRPLAVPSRVTAVLDSPITEPVTPRVTPVPALPSSKPTESIATGPVAPLSDQYGCAPWPTMNWSYALSDELSGATIETGLPAIELPEASTT